LLIASVFTFAKTRTASINKVTDEADFLDATSHVTSDKLVTLITLELSLKECRILNLIQLFPRSHTLLLHVHMHSPNREAVKKSKSTRQIASFNC
jgi:hypothetical protein